MAVWLDVLSNAHGLRCANGDKTGCKGRCEHKAGLYLGQPWDRCPVAEMNDDLKLVYVINLDSQSQLSPLSGWPDDFAAWVPRYWSRLVSARNDRVKHQGGNRGR